MKRRPAREQSAFQLTNEFLNLMLDPFVNGRGYGPGAAAAAAARSALRPTSRRACRPMSRSPTLRSSARPTRPQVGGSFRSALERLGRAPTAAAAPPAAIRPSAVTTSRRGTYGFAAGMDYHVSPSTILGFAMAGAGTNWGLSSGLGGGYSDALQVGTYGISWFGRAYLAGALSFTNHWFTTNRSALGDQLTANFVGQSYGARFEGGYRCASLPRKRGK